MRLVLLARTHARIAARQRALWLTAIPLTAVAWTLAVISPARPGTGGIEDAAFTGQVLALFTGIAYAAAFTDFLTVSARLGMSELETAAPTSALQLRAARTLGTLAVILVPAAAVLLLTGIWQTLTGHLWALPAALAVALTVSVPAGLLALSLSALAGALLPTAVGRITAVLAWFALVFSSPLIPLPTLNGSVFAVNGDPVVNGLFGAHPIYPPAGPVAYDGSAGAAAVSLIAQFVLVAVLLAAGSLRAGRVGRR